MKKKVFVQNPKQLKELLKGYPDNGHEPDQFGFTGTVEGGGLDNATGSDLTLKIFDESNEAEIVVAVSALLAWALYPTRKRED